MIARPFSRLEPVSNPEDPARAIATVFAVVAGVGVLPGLFGAIMLGMMFVVSVTEPNAAAPMFLAALAYVLLGFAQLRFYLSRATTRRSSFDERAQWRRNARAWWLSTFFYNLIPAVMSIVGFVNEVEIGWLISAMWFATLSTLAIVAYGAEERHNVTRPRPGELVRRGRPL